MITVNAMGDNCPIPVIKTKKAMQEITGPETIEVLVDNEIAVQNVTKMAVSSGGNVTSEKLGEKEFKVTIQMNGAVAKEAGEEAVCTPDRKGDTIVVIASDKMGSGNDELGKVLIKGFICGDTAGRIAKGDDLLQWRGNFDSRRFGFSGRFKEFRSAGC